MAEYRRFVAYIYEYVNGIKGENAGFVKVESRNGICRIQLHLQAVPAEETSLQVDGFVRTQNHVGVIPLGMCRVKGKSAEFKGNTPHRNFGNSDYSLEQIAGMFLEGENGSVFATAWDNEPIDVDELKRFAKNVHMKQKAAVVNKENPEAVKSVRGDKAPEFKDSMEKLADAGNVSGISEKEETDAAANAQKNDDSRLAEESSETAESDGMPGSEELSAAEGRPDSEMFEAKAPGSEEVKEANGVENAGEVREASIDADADELSSGDAEGESESTDSMVGESVEADENNNSNNNVGNNIRNNVRNSGYTNNGNTNNNGSSNNQYANSNRNSNNGYANNNGNSNNQNANNNGYANSGNQVHMAQARGRQQASGRCNMNCANSGLDRKWDQFQCHYPPMEPFTDDEIVECIRIAPKDIMFLRRDDQRFARNNFLLQSFYNYQHLMLGRLRDGGYVLGVPGLYENQERFMANMFGFMNFKEARPGKQENFGYWLRPVR